MTYGTCIGSRQTSKPGLAFQALGAKAQALMYSCLAASMLVVSIYGDDTPGQATGILEAGEAHTLTRCKIPQEELRALRTAVQLMVKRSEEKSMAQSSLQPASSAMEPIQEGGSEAEGSGGSPAEEATPEPPQSEADLPQAPEPHSPAKASPRGLLFLWCHGLGRTSLRVGNCCASGGFLSCSLIT